MFKVISTQLGKVQQIQLQRKRHLCTYICINNLTRISQIYIQIYKICGLLLVRTFNFQDITVTLIHSNKLKAMTLQ